LRTSLRPGFTGTDSFQYQASDGSLTSAPATVTMEVPTRVWYADNAATPPGDGRDASPFATLKAAESASAAGETVFVLAGDGTSAGYDEGFVFKSAQALTGQGIASDVTVMLNGESVVLLAAGAAPSLTRTDAGATLALAQDNTVQGVEVASTAGAGIAGSGFGMLTAGSISVAAAGGPSLDLSSGTVAAAFGELSSAGSAGTGLRLAAWAACFRRRRGASSARRERRSR
jgi:trimeric autotransporter adhesin